MHGPIYLTADSLLWAQPSDPGAAFVELIHGQLAGPAPTAAYIGASNGDEPAYYAFFELLMDALGIGDRRMIRAGYTPDERAFVEAADLILLAGGDVARGWRVIESTGMRESIRARHGVGAALIGVSAGAVQLGAGMAEMEMFGLAPWFIDVHREREDWAELRRAVSQANGCVPGLGIPHGGAVACMPDGVIEVVGRPALEFTCEGGEVAVTHRHPT